MKNTHQISLLSGTWHTLFFGNDTDGDPWHQGGEMPRYGIGT